MKEVDLTPWLPNMWGGRADWLLWNPRTQGFILADLKTTKGDGIHFIQQYGAKDEHRWQLSPYWYALEKMGLPLEEKFVIYYLPVSKKSVSRWADENPITAFCKPVPVSIVKNRMELRAKAAKEYLDQVKTSGEIVNDALVPPQKRDQKLYWNKDMFVFDLKLVPHWSTKFCRYEEPYCNCSSQKINKIGHFTLEEEYIPREGYENIVPDIRPDEETYHKRRQEEKSERSIRTK